MGVYSLFVLLNTYNLLLYILNQYIQLLTEHHGNFTGIPHLCSQDRNPGGAGPKTSRGTPMSITNNTLLLKDFFKHTFPHEQLEQAKALTFTKTQEKFFFILTMAMVVVG